MASPATFNADNWAMGRFSDFTSGVKIQIHGRCVVFSDIIRIPTVRRVSQLAITPTPRLESAFKNFNPTHTRSFFNYRGISQIKKRVLGQNVTNAHSGY